MKPSKYNFDILDPFWYISVLLFFLVPLKCIVITMLFGWSEYSKEYPSLNESLILTILFIIPLYMSLMVFLKTKKMNMLFFIKEHNVKLTLSPTIVICIFAGFLFFAELNIRGLSIYLLIANSFVEYKTAENSITGLILSSSYSILLNLAIFLNAATLYSKGKNLPSLLIAIGVYVLISIFTGSRHTFVIMFFNILLARNIYYKKLNIKKFLLLAIVGVVFAGFYGQVRMTKDVINNPEVLLRITDSNTVKGYVFDVLDKRFDSYFPNIAIYLENRDLFGLRYGYDILKLVIMPIPRSILPEKDILFGQEFNDKLQIISKGGTGYSPIVEAMVNFSIPGIIVYAILGSFLLSVLSNEYRYNMRRRNKLTLFYIVNIGMIVPSCVIISSGYGSIGMLLFVMNTILYLIILKFLQVFCSMKNSFTGINHPQLQ